jgi:phosphate transport system protein
MRDAYHEELAGIGKQLVAMARMAETAIEQATRALLETDLDLAQHVIAADGTLDAVHHDLEERALELLARQQPVATELRTVVASLRMSADLERMGDLAQHVAKVARLRYPTGAIPAEVCDVIREMGQVARRMAARTACILTSRDVRMALALEGEDDEMDRLHRTLFHHLMDTRWTHGVETAVDVALCSRYYERFADHAVSVAKQVVFLVTGERAADYIDFGGTFNASGS